MRQMLMTRRTVLGAGLAAAWGGMTASGLLSGCATADGRGWTVLFDGATSTDLVGWTPLGEGNWRVTDGTIEGRNGKAGFLVSADSYRDFEIESEFWADADCNSGIFIRCQDRDTITAANAYEVNIFDKRPDPNYGTAAIVDLAMVARPFPQAANRWNTFRIFARGDWLQVVFNGQVTVDVRDRRLREGPIALQSAAGTVRFRTVKIRPLA